LLSSSKATPHLHSVRIDSFVNVARKFRRKACVLAKARAKVSKTGPHSMVTFRQGWKKHQKAEDRKPRAVRVVGTLLRRPSAVVGIVWSIWIGVQGVGAWRSEHSNTRTVDASKITELLDGCLVLGAQRLVTLLHPTHVHELGEVGASNPKLERVAVGRC
jgi:hypothetical protein